MRCIKTRGGRTVISLLGARGMGESLRSARQRASTDCARQDIMANHQPGVFSRTPKPDPSPANHHPHILRPPLRHLPYFSFDSWSWEYNRGESLEARLRKGSLTHLRSPPNRNPNRRKPSMPAPQESSTRDPQARQRHADPHWANSSTSALPRWQARRVFSDTLEPNRPQRQSREGNILGTSNTSPRPSNSKARGRRPLRHLLLWAPFSKRDDHSGRKGFDGSSTPAASSRL